MKTKHILTVIFALGTQMLLAQTKPLSLNDAINLALAKRYDLKIQKLNTQVNEKQASEVNTRSLPQLTSDLDSRFNSQLQTNVLPGNVFGPANSPDRRVQFGTKYNTSLDVNLNQSILNPTNVADKQIAKLQTDYQRQNEKLTEVNVKQEVTEAYFSALLWKEKIKLSEENVKREEDIVAVTQHLLGLGQATAYDVQKDQIDLENAKATDAQNKNSYELSINDLLYKISADSIKNPELTDNISALMDKYKVTVSDSVEISRTELTQERIQTQIYSANVMKQKLLWLPTISFYGNYSLQYLNNDFAPFGTKNWYPFNYFGIKASFSIFDGGLKSKTQQEYRLRAEASNYQYIKLKNDYTQETLNAQTTLKNALLDLNYQKKNLGLIEDMYRIDSERLKNGTIKQTDLTTTYYTLQQTQTNYFNALYNYLIAVVRYKKASGAL